MRAASHTGRSRLALALAGPALALVLCTSPAVAQSDEDRAGARAAATAGATAFDEGKWAEAVDLFTRAETLVHAPPHLLFIARAYLKMGRLVRARENYLKITREALAPSAPKAFTEAHAAAKTEIASLEARIPTVKISVDGEGAQSASLVMDGNKLASALAGVPFPIDPGEHKFAARTKTLTSEEVTVKVAEGANEALSLSLKIPLPKSAEDPEPVVVPTAPPPADRAPPPTEKGNGLRIASYAAVGVGVLGGVVGTLFLTKNHSTRDEVDALCPDGRCPESQRTKIASLDRDADSAGTMAWVGYGVGLAGLAAGATLFVLSIDKPKTEAKATRIRPVVGTSFLGVAGSF